MHEYGITQSIINIVCEACQKKDVTSVKTITLVIGELSSIIDDSVQMYFDILSEDTVCRGAKLIFKRINAKLECINCKQLFDRKADHFNCPNCGGVGRLTDIGKEFYIDNIEVE